MSNWCNWFQVCQQLYLPSRCDLCSYLHKGCDELLHCLLNISFFFWWTTKPSVCCLLCEAPCGCKDTLEPLGGTSKAAAELQCYINPALAQSLGSKMTNCEWADCWLPSVSTLQFTASLSEFVLKAWREKGWCKTSLISKYQNMFTLLWSDVKKIKFKK